MVNIIIAGTTDLFPCPTGWKVGTAVAEIRSRYVLAGGGVNRNGEAMAAEDLIANDGATYEFVDFQAGIQAPVITTVNQDNLARFLKPGKSASTIANSNQEYYDVFAHVCQAQTYIPNKRAQGFLTLEPPYNIIKILEMKIMGSWLENDTFRKIKDGSETKVADINLQWILGFVPLCFEESETKMMVCKFTTDPGSNYLQSAMKTEHCFVYNSKKFKVRIALVGSEAKGLEASLRTCYPQLISLCGSAAIELVQLGVAVENAVIPCIAIAGGFIQVCLVYLVNPCFPVLVAVSRALNPLGSFEDLHEFAKWLLRCYLFGNVTADLIEASRRSLDPPITQATLDTSLYFFKPVRGHLKDTHFTSEQTSSLDDASVSTLSNSLNYVMHLYEQLASKTTEEVERFILFPCGVISGMSNDVDEHATFRAAIEQACKRVPNFSRMDICFKPIILFPLLVNYHIEKPPPHLCDSYLEKLRQAVGYLDHAGVAHLDLRPDNIMWKANEDNSAIEDLKLIDFETAVLFGHVIPTEYVKQMMRDVERRYPVFTSYDRYQFANASHNQFFVGHIETWLKHSSDANFGSFMMTRKRTAEEVGISMNV